MTTEQTHIPTDSDAGPSGVRRASIIAGIGLVAIAFCTMVSVVWWHSWFEQPITPVSVIYIVGDAAVQDAVAILDRPDDRLIPEAGSMPLPMQKRFTPGPESGTFACRLAIPAGTYSLRVKRESTVLFAHPHFTLSENGYWPLDLRKKDAKGAT